MFGVQACRSKRCLLCPQILENDRYTFNCGFVFEVIGHLFTCNATDVIYVIRCTTCHAEYIGETQNLRKRMNKHKYDIQHDNREFGCRATDHLVKCGCDLATTDRFSIFILDKEKDTQIRKAKESYYINLFLPKMNK